MKRVIRVCLPLPIDGFFDYAADKEVEKGARILVPFGTRKMVGYCVAGVPGDSRRELKSVIKIVDETPLLTNELFDIAGWMKDFYFSPLGMVLKMILPPQMTGEPKDKPRPLCHLERSAWISKTEKIAKSRREVLLLRGRGSQDRTVDFGNCGTVFFEGNRIEFEKAVVSEISKQIKNKKEVIFLAPSIEKLKRWECVFGHFLHFVFHSKLKNSQRLWIYKAARNGSFEVLAGTRSAVFAPFGNLGLIVMVEPADRLFLEEQHPRYSTFEVAKKRAKISNAKLFCFSEVLSVEQFYEVEARRAERIFLGEEMSPNFEICDVSQNETNFLISSNLLARIRENVSNGKKSVVFFPRGGWAGKLVCAKCGFTATCPKCGRNLAVSKFLLYCPRCRKSYPLPKRCPSCGAGDLKSKGVGRTHIASFLRRHLPADVYSIELESGKGSQKNTLERFEKTRAAVLVCDGSYRAVSDWRDIGIFAVVDADFPLYGGDWRGEERIFSFFRNLKFFISSANPLTAIFVQTRLAAEIVEMAFRAPEIFYRNHLEMRRKFNFPPYARVIKVEISGKNSKRFYSALLKKNAEIILENTELRARGEARFEATVKIKSGSFLSFPSSVRGAKAQANESY
ncbi:MAG: hypothetical protein J7L54_02590 [Elusimicrobia bacterium]|nr:hypothetical protein [Elusimicrobiota bacterium]